MTMDIDTLRGLALAMLIAERRPLVMLDDEVRQALGMRARKGRLRLDDLSLRLVQLIDSADVWRVRAERARRVVVRPALTWDRGVGRIVSVGPAASAGHRRAG